MQNTGRIIARDIFKHKLKLVEENAARLGISIIHTELYDAVLPDEKHAGAFDGVLLDAPCTGLGIVRRKPDIKWARETKDINTITELQKKLLNNAAMLLKPGGVLVYSTCTVLPEENEYMVKDFLAGHTEFAGDEIAPFLPVGLAQHANGCMVQLFSNRDGIDGFFVARLRKKTE
jgi:16S rRNA (cytosine967-C5)-methyltransferase